VNVVAHDNDDDDDNNNNAIGEQVAAARHDANGLRDETRAAVSQATRAASHFAGDYYYIMIIPVSLLGRRQWRETSYMNNTYYINYKS
jgi:hypothetical protein